MGPTNFNGLLLAVVLFRVGSLKLVVLVLVVVFVSFNAG